MHKSSLRPKRLAQLCSCVGFALLLTACQPAKPESAATTAASLDEASEAAGVYVILPGGYSRYLAEGLILASNGTPEDLPVYPAAEEATRALQAFEAHAEHARYIWQVFRLEANWDKDVIALDNEYRLSGPARVAAVIKDEARR